LLNHLPTLRRHLRALLHAPLRIWIAVYAAVGLCVMLVEHRGTGSAAALVVLLGAGGLSLWLWWESWGTGRTGS
jgi:hypothetical protein